MGLLQMHYIVFDLELNSKPFKNRHPNEVIEIGAVKLDESLQQVSTFQAYVKPKVYGKLFGIVRKKTRIDQKDIDGAEDFKSVISLFRQWAGRNFVLFSWGHDDIHHLRTNCKLHHVNARWLQNSIDLQKQFSDLAGLPASNRSGLQAALESLAIEVPEKLHRAYIDARYTAEIFIRIFDRLNLSEFVTKK